MEKTAEAARDKDKLLEKKLERCRNPENNPDSEMYVLVDLCRFWFSFNRFLTDYLQIQEENAGHAGRRR